MTKIPVDRCYIGDVRDVLRAWVGMGVKVNCIVTSPPYWGLRSYLPAEHDRKRLEIGSEPTLREFLATMVDVFDLCRQLLSDDGVCWVNMGDSYAGSRQGPAGVNSSLMGNGHQGGGPKHHMTESRRRDDHEIPRSDLRVDGLKPKDLVGQPWRLAFALQDAGWYLRQDVIWAKPNPMPESVRDRCTKAHEYLFLLTKSERYWWDFDAMQEPASPDTHARYARGRSGSHKYADGGPGGQTIARSFEHMKRKLAEVGSGTKNNASMDAALAVMPSTRNRRSVWTVPTEPYSGAHFATFPSALIEPCILAGCPAGGVVLDPFMGSGTTAMVAQRLGRRWLGIDIDERNLELQRDRIGRQTALILDAA